MSSSVQLFLNPQSYVGYIVDGTTTVIVSPSNTEYIADPNLNGSGGLVPWISESEDGLDFYAMQYHNPINDWKGIYSISGGVNSFRVAAPPAIVSGNCRLYTATSSAGGNWSHCGMFQEVQGMVSGVTYEISVEFAAGLPASNLSIHVGSIPNAWTAPNANLYNSVFYPNNATSTASAGWVAVGSVSKLQFVYTGTHPAVLHISLFSGQLNEYVDIKSVSLKEAPYPTVVTSSVTDGKVICDLYEDENIPLSLSVDNFKNAAENVQSYSKDFNLPATKRNNKIFSNVFEVTRVTNTLQTFNPYRITKAELKQDGFTIFDGFLKLLDVVNKEGEISYNVNLYSDPVILSEILGKKTLNDIQLDELQHLYYKDNITKSWDDAVGLELENNLLTTSFAYDAALGLGNTNVLKYPWVNWEGAYVISGSIVELEVLEDAFRPWIQCKYLVDRIFHEAGFSYTSTFLNSVHFTKLFMDFNWGAGLESQGGGISEWRSHYETDADIRGISGTWVNYNLDTNTPSNTLWDTSTHKLTATATNTVVDMSFFLTLKNTNSTYTYCQGLRWIQKDASGATINTYNNYSNIKVYGTSAIFNGPYLYYTGNVNIIMDLGDTLEAQFKGQASFKLKQWGWGVWQSNQANWNISAGGTKTHNMIMSGRGELNQWEFFKGFLTMFNLIITQDKNNPTNFIIETYYDTFIKNTDIVQLDWTEKIDVSEIKLTPLNLARKQKFSYEEDDGDYTLEKYAAASNPTGYLYGTKERDFVSLTELTDEEEIIATPFAPTIIKPLSPDYDASFVIPSVYSGNEDGSEFDAFENLPRILYNNGVKQLNYGSYSSPIQNHATSKFTTEGEFLQFSHLSDTTIGSTTAADYNFGECPLFGNLPQVSDNLYNTFWSPYFDELYHLDTRIMTLKVNLNASDIVNFEFFYTVFIKNRIYRVNKIDYRPNELSTVEFILLHGHNLS